MSYQLWDHQAEAVARAKDRNEFALFFDVGTGKTATAIYTLKAWQDREGRLQKTIVFCPPIVMRQWREEIGKYSDLQPYVILLEGHREKRVKLFKEHKNEPRIFITNYEALLMPELFVEFMQAGFDAMICDESHKLKEITAKRTKLATALSKQVKKRLIMTGTPILNSPMDLFSQFLILDKGETFGTNFFVFRATYFYDKNAGMPKHSYFPDWRPRPGIEEKINALIQNKSMRAKKELLKLPPLVREELPVEMSREQLKMYNEMKEDLITYLHDKVCVAPMALIKVLRLQQIVSGFLSMDTLDGESGHIHRFKDVPRLDALSALLEDLAPHHKVIVWACFSENYHRIRGVCEQLNLKYVEITGERTETQKREAITSFRADDGARVCIANQKAGGVGLNLIESSYSIYYSRGYSLEDDLQSEARNYRGGSQIHDRITRIDLVTRNSVDDIILNALKGKQNIATKILDMKRELTLGY